ncbi:MAG: Transcription termination protein NusB, partial [Acidobacteriaceae bacterium]|nr:Transcription termination protein NusB [Acidobacteriaceae bacterium]
TRGFAEDLFRMATTREEEIDTLIGQYSANWRIPRMPAVDRNLLRLAVAELVGFPGTPVPIVINESLEIAKRYSAPESLGFVNGILDAIAKSR